MNWADLRSAIRFPIRLPVSLLIGGEDVKAFTINMSANGVLLEVPEPIATDTELEFLLQVPKDITNSDTSVAIHCAGHVIRSYDENANHYIAAVLDEYSFQ